MAITVVTGRPEARRLDGRSSLSHFETRCGQRRDDQLVEAVDVDRVLDRRQRLRDADHALDRAARGLLEQRQRQLERLLGLRLRLILGVHELVQAVRGVRDQQREASPARGPPARGPPRSAPASRRSCWRRRGPWPLGHGHAP